MKLSFFTLLAAFVLSASPVKADQALIIAPIYPYDLGTISKGHMFTSSILTGLNLSSIAVNGYQMKRNSINLTLPIIGIGTGVAQIVSGAMFYRTDVYYDYYYGYPQTHQFNNRISMMDIGVGTLSAAFNTYALIRAVKGRKKRSDLSWNVFGYRNAQTQQVAMGFTLRKQI